MFDDIKIDRRPFDLSKLTEDCSTYQNWPKTVRPIKIIVLISPRWLNMILSDFDWFENYENHVFILRRQFKKTFLSSVISMLEKKQSHEIMILNVSVEIYFAGTQHRWKSPWELYKRAMRPSSHIQIYFSLKKPAVKHIKLRNRKTTGLFNIKRSYCAVYTGPFNLLSWFLSYG